ncbi:MAG TPA: hypothetical protein VGV85_10290 [Longimicrobiaceae bacterium]|nr:hypothetical protein [Longimicrobiaceae bacterium]
MPLLLAVLAVMLLASGVNSQSPGRTASGSADGAFYAEGGSSLQVRLFGTVRVRADSVEVVVSDGAVARPWVSFIHREGLYERVRLRAHLGVAAWDEPSPEVGGGFVEVLDSIGPGEEHPVRPVRFVVPRPPGPLDSLGLVFQVYVADPSSPYPGDKQFYYVACGRYGAFARPLERARSYGSCGVPRERAAAARPARPPVRPVCVEDPASPNGMRPSDVIVERLAGDSALSRSGERRPLSEFRPRIVGYVAGPQGLEPPGMDVRDHEPWQGAQLFGRTYARNGLPRPVPPDQLIRIGEALGASVFTTPGGDVLEHPVLYVLLPDCTLQPYQPPAH